MALVTTWVAIILGNAKRAQDLQIILLESCCCCQALYHNFVACECRCQHMFVNPDRPRSAYGMAYNSVATGDNSATFNDGYHILHHLNSITHWSELPGRFLKHLDQHIEQKGAPRLRHNPTMHCSHRCRTISLPGPLVCAAW